ncbi:MAG: TolC family protein [Bacteroidales bacterium]
MKPRLQLLMAILSGMLCFPGNLSAQQTERSLQSCIDQALEKNIQIQQNRLNIEVSRIQVDQAQTNRFPSVAASMRQGFGWGNQTDQITGTDSFDGSSSTTASFSTGWVIYNGGKLNTSIRQARLDFESGKLDLEALKETISLSVMDAYLQILYAEEQVSNSRQQIFVTTGELRLAAERLALSAISKADYLQIQSQLASEKLTLTNAQSLLDINNLNLMQLIEQPVDNQFSIAKPTLNDLINRYMNPDPDSVFRIALEIKPQIKSYILKQQISQLGIEQAKADYYPRLSLDAGFSTGYYSVDQSVALAGQLGKNINPTLGLSMSVPIYSNNKTRNQVQIARLATQTADLDLKNSMNQLRKSIEQACTDVNSAEKEYEASVDQYNSNLEASAVAAEKFKQGMINSVDYLFQKTNLITAESKLLQSRYNLIFSYKLIDFYSGKSLNL